MVSACACNVEKIDAAGVDDFDEGLDNFNVGLAVFDDHLLAIVEPQAHTTVVGLLRQELFRRNPERRSPHEKVGPCAFLNDWPELMQRRTSLPISS